MPKNEDGEFELVLGNKQLLSMFFVVVILLGVFFVMGYIVGRNSAPLASTEPAHKPEGKPLVVESPVPKTASPAETPAAAAPAAPAAAPEKAAETPSTPAPPATAETTKPEPAAKTKAEKAEAKAEKAEAKAEQSKAEKARPQAQSNQPVAGATYLQLSATAKHDADAMVEELRKNGFLALDAEVPEKPGTFRVLVGPIPTGELNKTKTELQNKSFPGNVAIPKKF